MYSSNAQPTGTNRPRACHPPTTRPNKTCHASTTQNLNQQPTPPPTNPHNTGDPTQGATHRGKHGTVHNRTTVHNVTAAIAAGKHPDPSRTRKLSQPAPMVLHPTGCGRVGRRRTSFTDGGHLRDGPHRYRGQLRAHAESFPRSERTWQTVVVSRVRERPVGVPRMGDAGRASQEVAGGPTRGAARAVAGPVGRRARATGLGRPPNRVHAPPTRSGTTVRRCPRTSPDASSTAR